MDDMDDSISVTMPSPLKAEVEKRQTKGNAKYCREAIRARMRAEDDGTWKDPGRLDFETPLPDGGQDE